MNRRCKRLSLSQEWAAAADAVCRRIAAAAAVLLVLVIAAQAALHADGIRPWLSKAERLEGVPFGDR